MIAVITRTIIVYAIILFSMRLMGKKQLGELQPSELVSTILISNLASVSIENIEAPFITSAVAIFLIVAFEIILSGACVKYYPLAKIISGSPKIVILDGEILQVALTQLRLTVSELMEALRGKDCFSIDEVYCAIVETNGSMSVIKYASFANATLQDINPKCEKNDVPQIPVVINGMVQKDNFMYCKISKNDIENILQKEKTPMSSILVMTAKNKDKYTIIKKENE